MLFGILFSILDLGFRVLLFLGLLRGACPEHLEILPLHFVQGQNDRRRRARNDKGKTQNDRKGGFMVEVVKGASGLSGAGSWGKSRCRGSAEKYAQWGHHKWDRACLSCEQL